MEPKSNIYSGTLQISESMADRIFDVSMSRTKDKTDLPHSPQRLFQDNYAGICAEVATRLLLELDPEPALERFSGGDEGWDIETPNGTVQVKGRHQDQNGSDLLIPERQWPPSCDYYVVWRNNTPYHLKFLGWADKVQVVEYAYFYKALGKAGNTPCRIIQRRNLITDPRSFKQEVMQERKKVPDLPF